MLVIISCLSAILESVLQRGSAQELEETQQLLAAFSCVGASMPAASCGLSQHSMLAVAPHFELLASYIHVVSCWPAAGCSMLSPVFHASCVFLPCAGHASPAMPQGYLQVRHQQGRDMYPVPH
jgi:hypothetical protein